MSSLEEVIRKHDELIRKSTASKVFVILRDILTLIVALVAFNIENLKLVGIALFLLCCYTFPIRYVRYFKKLDDEDE